MTYYVTGFFKKTNKGSGYYAFDTVNAKTVIATNKTLKSNVKAVDILVNVRMNNTRDISKPILSGITKDGFTIEYKPSLVNKDTTIERNETLVSIDFNRRQFGIVDHFSTEITWKPIEMLVNLGKDEAYNNLAYETETGLLDIGHYDIIGAENRFDIRLVNFIGKKENNVVVEKETEDIIEVEDTETEPIKNVEDTETEDIKEVEEDKAENTTSADGVVVPTEDSNECTDIVSWLTTNRSRYSTESISITQKQVYEGMLLMLRDDDTITLPTWVVRELKFTLVANIKTSMNLDRRVSIYTVLIDKKPLVLIVKFNASLDYVRVQVAMSAHLEEGKNYAIEEIKSKYNKWAQNNKYITI